MVIILYTLAFRIEDERQEFLSLQLGRVQPWDIV